MVTRNCFSFMFMGTVQGDFGEMGILLSFDVGILDIGLVIQLKMKFKKVRKIKVFILDLGFQYCKCGYVGELRFIYFIFFIVGKYYFEVVDVGDNRKEIYVGYELFNMEAFLKLVNSLKYGVVVDWDCVQNILEYVFYIVMKIFFEDYVVLFFDVSFSFISNREKYVEFMFEIFGIFVMYVTFQSLLFIYFYGKILGLVVESGYGVSYVVFILEGNVLSGLTSRIDYVGSDFINYLLQLFNGVGYQFTDDYLYIIEYIKKECCYSVFVFEEEFRLGLEELYVVYEFFDGKFIIIGYERFQCVEMFFKFILVGSSDFGFYAVTVVCLGRCQEAGFKEEMAVNVLLCGGCIMLEGFFQRFQRELSFFCFGDSFLVVVVFERKIFVWIGGFILVFLQVFQQFWVSKEEFRERGSVVIYSKC